MSMKVGMLRKRKNPTKIARATAFACKHYGIEFFYFRPQDVDMEKKVIKGFFAEKGEWIRKETSYPDVIDNALPTTETEELYAHLEEHCYFTTRRLGTKASIYKLMENDGGFNDILIPFVQVKSMDDLNSYLEKYNNIVLKPVKGSQGKSIYQLTIEDGKYKLSTNTTINYYNYEELTEVAEKIFKDKKYLIQPFINSRTNEGHPFDIRLQVRRAKDGEWKLIVLLPRIGIGNSITSNVNQGGGISLVDPFLKTQFGEKADEIKAMLEEIAATFPQKLQRHFDFEIDGIGIDIGLDENGKPWFFEVNTSPGPKWYETDFGEAKAQHYEYIIHEKLASKTAEQ